MQLKALNNKKKLLIPSRISTKLFNKIQIIGKPVFNEIILFKELSEIKNWGQKINKSNKNHTGLTGARKLINLTRTTLD